MQRAAVTTWVVLMALALYAGCGGDVSASASGSGGASGVASGTGGSAGAGGDGSASSSTGSGQVFSSCHDPAPAGAAEPPPLPAYSGGSCPVLAPGLNVVNSAGNDRDFLLVLPSDYTPGERLPVVFLWHWLGGDAEGFLQQGEVQAAADAFRVIAVAPEAKGDLQFTWPFDAFTASAARVDEELTFFDDMLSCVATQYQVNTSCVASAGVSAGALWTSAVLANRRSEYLSSFIALSGGTGGMYIKPWQPAARKLPAIVLWGGPTDLCVIIDFEETSTDLEQNLAKDGHFFVECVHNCGHSAPPFDDVSSISKLDAVWQFTLDHPYWLNEGTSPYQEGALPMNFPDWCGVGMGSAVPREGECTNGQGC